MRRMRKDEGGMKWMPVEVYPRGLLFVPVVTIAVDGEIRGLMGKFGVNCELRYLNSSGSCSIINR